MCGPCESSSAIHPETNIVLVGGGIMSASTAYFLSRLDAKISLSLKLVL